MALHYDPQLVAEGPFQLACAGPLVYLEKKKKKIVEHGPCGDWGRGWGRPFATLFVNPPFCFLRLLFPQFLRSLFLFQARGKYFGRVVETGLLFFFKDGKFLFIGKVIHFQRCYRARQLQDDFSLPFLGVVHNTK